MGKHTIELGGGLIAAIMAGICSSWQVVVVLFILYALALIGNLITGLLAAFQTNTYDPDIGRKAVYRKLSVVIGIAVLACIDFIIMGLARTGGITYSIPFLTVVMAGYSGVHELTSMLNNIKRLGNKVPAAIEEAAEKAEEALAQGKIPDLAGILKGKKAGE